MANKVSMSFEPVWETKSGSHLLEGPAISPDGKKVYFTDLWLGNVYSLSLDDLNADPELVHCFAPYRCNGLQFLAGEKNTIAVCVWEGLPLVSWEKTGAILTLDLDEAIHTPTTKREYRVRASGFKWPNDLAVTPAGGIYFTDFMQGCVYYLAPDSKSPNIVIDKLCMPNGIELQFDSGNETVLFVAESGRNQVLRYELTGPGCAEVKRIRFEFGKRTRVDGLALNSDGVLLVAEKSAVYALDATNLTCRGHDPLVEQRRTVPSNICFTPEGSFVVTSYKFFLFRKAELFLGNFNAFPSTGCE